MKQIKRKVSMAVIAALGVGITAVTPAFAQQALHVARQLGLVFLHHHLAGGQRGREVAFRPLEGVAAQRAREQLVDQAADRDDEHVEVQRVRVDRGRAAINRGWRRR